MMKTMLALLFALVPGFTALAAEAGETPQMAAARTINKLLLGGKFEELYRDWCHPHLRKQLDEDEFSEAMKGDFGKAVTKLFAEVIKAVDDEAGPEVVVARLQEDEDEYEFILKSARENSYRGKRGTLWHLELKLHDGKWKLMDAD